MSDGRIGKSKIVKMMLYQNKSSIMNKSDIRTSITISRSARMSFIRGRLYRNLNLESPSFVLSTQIYEGTLKLVKKQCSI